MLDESSLQFSGQLVANLERPNLQDVTGVVESGESRAKHDSNFARPRLALEMGRFTPDCDRRVPVVLCEKISAAVRYRENQTDYFAFSGSGRACSCRLLAATFGGTGSVPSHLKLDDTEVVPELGISPC